MLKNVMILRRTLLASLMAALRKERIDEAQAKIQAATASGFVSSAALYIRQGRWSLERGFGKARGAGEVFLLASITKTMTAAAVMKLVEAAQVRLEDAVQRFIPEFAGGDRGKVQVRHLLTHTSGLPDMLPENEALRRRHAPLKEFVAATCKTPLLFVPGTEVRYQSMGILLAAEIVERVGRQPLPEFLRQEFFLPLGMRQTSLGLGGRRIADTALCQVEGNPDWNWNSPYWRNLGAPWGGAHAPARDVGRWLEFFLHPRDGVLRASTARQMITDQNAGLGQSWGLGFKTGPGSFGLYCSPKTFGHSGATGTLAWADPDKDLIFVLLTTKPAEQSRTALIDPVSNLVSAA